MAGPPRAGTVMGILSRARIVLGVSGSIAAYKAAELASRLVQAGAEVDTVMTPGARHFVQPLTFSAITGRAVHDDPFVPWRPDFAGHVSLARDASIVVVAPASANTIARLAIGLADDMLSAICLSTTAPVVLAPAMEHQMWHHPATRQNIETLRRRGVTLVEPESGRLASGARGDGRLAGIEALAGAVRLILGRDGPLAGRKIVISAGGTREPIDPVRYIGNRSSGLMGFALARAALDLGAAVTIVQGSTTLAAPYGATALPVETAAEMHNAVMETAETADALIMAAAVADFRPARAASHKLKKQPGEEKRIVELERTVDILAAVTRPGLVKVGFAAETEELVPNARQKLDAKQLDLIVANDAAATIGSETSTAVLIGRGGDMEHLPALAKTELAVIVMQRLVALLNDREAERG